ncbi:TPA: hypothetical protein MJC07_24160 [Klebsiella pneumoniae]|nr:hypothetical protein [Klebsiella pneumoniae]
MKYFIENQVVFNTDDGTLTDTSTQEIISLPVPAVRLLEEFSRSDGRNLTRGYLLEKVWEEHGLQATDGNLRQYISILRRHLSALGFPELIVTLPRVGFKVHPGIAITLDAVLPELQAQSNSTDDKTASFVESTPKNGLATTGLKTVSYVLSAGVIFTLLLWYVVVGREQIDNSVITSGDCEIILVKNVSQEVEKKIINHIHRILSNNKLVCTKDNFIVFDQQRSVSSGNNSRTMLSFCTKGEDGNTTSCENFYRYQIMEHKNG